MKIRALLLDVDGVLTDGRLYLDDRGHEFKVFDTKDGHGIKRAVAAGIRVAWISGRNSRATLARARELGVHEVAQGVADKRLAAERILRRWKIPVSQAAACGDDLPDLGLFAAAGWTSCPADAVGDVRRRADLVLKSRGGRGAVRELIELLLRRNGPGR